MKVSQLKIKNLGPFHVKPVELDFENGTLADASLVAITGRTGAGKTMLFDAICVALYGKTPRLSSPKFLLSHGETEGYAEVVFEVNRSRYLAEWHVRRTNPETATTSRRLFNADSEKLLAEGRTVGAKVESILGLDFNAFTRSVMLAQGEFAAFLRATPAKKLAILEATAGIGIYDALRDELSIKMGVVEAELEPILGEFNAIPASSGEWVSDAEETLRGLEEKSRSLAAKRSVYTTAKSDVTQAQTRFAKAGALIPERERLDAQIGSLSNQLTEDRKRRTELERQIKEAVTFLDANPLPPDRQQLFTRVNRILVELSALRSQLKDRSADKVSYAARVSLLKDELADLSENRDKLIAKKAEAEAALAKVRKALETLQKAGSLGEWQIWKADAQRALPIAQRYENVSSRLGDEEREVEQLEKNLASVAKSLAGVGQELVVQTQVCKRADSEVSRLEAERELAVLADPINELRQKLEPGEPCLVCGATEHLCADEVEIETEKRLEILDNALCIARTTAREALENRNSLLQNQSRLEQNQTNLTEQIDARLSEIKRLNGETEAAQAQWQEIYPDTEISSEWASRQNQDAEAAMDALRKAEASCARATNDCTIVREQLINCDRNIGDKQSQLAHAEQDLQTVTDALEDLQADIAATETRFWETMPDAFHGLTLEDAVSQFKKRIKEVEAREDDLQTKRNQLSLIAADIRANRDSFKSAKEQRKSVHARIEDYQREANDFLAAASKKTGGLISEAKIGAEIKKLEVAIQNTQSEVLKQNLNIEDLKRDLTARKVLVEKVRRVYEEFTRWDSLRQAIAHPNPRSLSIFALQGVLEQVSQFANTQLEYLTSGRYQLKVEVIGEFSGIKLTVVDKWNANEERPVETLSGGESFLTSFALALGLSEASRGRAQIGSLFLDEGFGTLDAETLDTVINALEGVRLQGRSVFLISHIEKLTRHLPVEIRVRKERNGSSTVDFG